jgi:hypothetical protein
MKVRCFRRLSHAPHLRALALLAWLAMTCVPAVAAAQALAVSAAPGHAEVMHASEAAPMLVCCHGAAGNGSCTSHCQACVASATGLIVPVTFTVVAARFATPRWPLSSADIVVRSTAPPLRPPRC